MLEEAHIADADLLSANFIGADLPEGDDLLDLFKDVRSLFGARFDPDIYAALVDEESRHQDEPRAHDRALHHRLHETRP